MSFITKKDSIQFNIWDSGKIDNDIISIYHNDNLVIANYSLVKDKLILDVGLAKGNNIFKTPPWMKILIREVNDPLSIISNKTGGINVIDMANIYSCPFIATQDLGRTFDDGSFSVLGRFSNADVRGCNLLVQ